MKKRRVLSWIPAVMLTAALLVFPAYATESAETEPPAAPVEISTPEDLLAMAEVVPPMSKDWLMGLMQTILTLLTALGVVIDPTTEGAGDSDRAMTYQA